MASAKRRPLNDASYIHSYLKEAVFKDAEVVGSFKTYLQSPSNFGSKLASYKNDCVKALRDSLGDYSNNITDAQQQLDALFTAISTLLNLRNREVFNFAYSVWEEKMKQNRKIQKQFSKTGLFSSIWNMFTKSKGTAEEESLSDEIFPIDQFRLPDFSKLAVVKEDKEKPGGLTVAPQEKPPIDDSSRFGKIPSIHNNGGTIVLGNNNAVGPLSHPRQPSIPTLKDIKLQATVVEESCRAMMQAVVIKYLRA